MRQFTRGSSATFYHNFTDVGGVLVDPDALPTLTVMFNNAAVLSNVVMTRISVGLYSYTWAIPAGQTTGFYTAIYRGIIATVPVEIQEDFEVLVVPITPTIPNFYCTWDDVKAVLLGLDVAEMPTTLQDRVENIYIPNLKNEIDTYCRQNFDLTEVTQFFDGSGTEKIALFRRPINKLTNCILRVIPSISWYTFRRWRHINIMDSEGLTIATQGGPEPINETIMPPYTNPSDYTWESDIVKADLFVDCVNGAIIIPPRILYLEMQAIPFWNYTFLRGNDNVEITYTYGYENTNFPRDLRMASARLVACQILSIKGIEMGAGANSITMDGVARSFGGGMPYQALITDLRTQAYQTLDHFRRIGVGG